MKMSTGPAASSWPVSLLYRFGLPVLKRFDAAECRAHRAAGTGEEPIPAPISAMPWKRPRSRSNRFRRSRPATGCSICSRPRSSSDRDEAEEARANRIGVHRTALLCRTAAGPGGRAKPARRCRPANAPPSAGGAAINYPSACAPRVTHSRTLRTGFNGPTSLGRFAFHQPRQFPDIAAGMAHEEAPRRADGIDDTQSQIAQMPERRDIVGEKPVERVGGGGQAQTNRTAASAHSASETSSAPISRPRRAASSTVSAKRGGVLQAQIEALSGDGMDAMGAIARQRKARPHKIARQMEIQRIGPARAHHFGRAQMGAEARRHFGVERLLRPAPAWRAPCPWLPSTPARSGCPSSAEWRTGRTAGNVHRPRRCAAWRDAPWRRCRSADRTSRSRRCPFAPRNRNSRPSAAIASAALNLARRSTVGRRRRRRFDGHRAETAAGAISVIFVFVRDGGIKRGADMPVLRDMAQTVGAHFFRIEMQRKGRSRASDRAIADQNLADRLRIALPDAATPPAPASCARRHRPGPRPGHRIRAATVVVGRQRIGHRDLEAALGQGQRPGAGPPCRRR